VVEGSGWFVSEVEVDMPTKGKHYFFKCNSWLSRDKGDGQTSRIFTLDEGEASVVNRKPRMFIVDVKNINLQIKNIETCFLSLIKKH